MCCELDATMVAYYFLRCPRLQISDHVVGNKWTILKNDFEQKRKISQIWIHFLICTISDNNILLFILRRLGLTPLNVGVRSYRLLFPRAENTLIKQCSFQSCISFRIRYVEVTKHAALVLFLVPRCLASQNELPIHRTRQLQRPSEPWWCWPGQIRLQKCLKARWTLRLTKMWHQKVACPTTMKLHQLCARLVVVPFASFCYLNWCFNWCLKFVLSIWFFIRLFHCTGLKLNHLHRFQ